ncbi:hypothetical protein KKC60_01515 [Patescibacteria group bacterium]|nr:hypothetical protein [Patescibacteria group bacterium]
MSLTLLFDYYRFWYTGGFIRLLKYLKAYIVILANTFSVKILLKTYLSPWKRDVSGTQGLPLDQKLKIVLFNIFARIFGAIIKTFTLAVFLVCFAVLMVFEIFALVVWLLLPILVLEGIVVGLLFILSN